MNKLRFKKDLSCCELPNQFIQEAKMLLKFAPPLCVAVWLLGAVASAYGPRPACGPTEAEGWVTEPWTFGKKGIYFLILRCFQKR